VTCVCHVHVAVCGCVWLRVAACVVVWPSPVCCVCDMFFLLRLCVAVCVVVWPGPVSEPSKILLSPPGTAGSMESSANDDIAYLLGSSAQGGGRGKQRAGRGNAPAPAKRTGGIVVPSSSAAASAPGGISAAAAAAAGTPPSSAPAPVSGRARAVNMSAIMGPSSKLRGEGDSTEGGWLATRALCPLWAVSCIPCSISFFLVCVHATAVGGSPYVGLHV
jgi:hypothetical protein